MSKYNVTMEIFTYFWDVCEYLFSDKIKCKLLIKRRWWKGEHYIKSAMKKHFSLYLLDNEEFTHQFLFTFSGLFIFLLSSSLKLPQFKGIIPLSGFLFFSSFSFAKFVLQKFLILFCYPCYSLSQYSFDDFHLWRVHEYHVSLH